jgi:protein-arginine kinase activator protein McsA
MFNDEDDFLNQMNESDPMDELRIKELWEKSIEESMKYAYSAIEEMGMEVWLKTVPMNEERKLRILTNMLDWHEKREEFEKCALIVKGVNSLKTVNK